MSYNGHLVFAGIIDFYVVLFLKVKLKEIYIFRPYEVECFDFLLKYYKVYLSFSGYVGVLSWRKNVWSMIKKSWMLQSKWFICHRNYNYNLCIMYLFTLIAADFVSKAEYYYEVYFIRTSKILKIYIPEIEYYV